MRTYDYIIKEKDRCVVCILTIGTDGGSYRFSGVAKCSPDDEFSEDTGRRIAQRRALLKFKKAVINFTVDQVKSLEKRRAQLDQVIASRKKAIDNMRATACRINAELAELC